MEARTSMSCLGGCYYWVAPCLLFSHVARSTHDIIPVRLGLFLGADARWTTCQSIDPSLKPRLLEGGILVCAPTLEQSIDYSVRGKITTVLVCLTVYRMSSDGKIE